MPIALVPTPWCPFAERHESDNRTRGDFPATGRVTPRAVVLHVAEGSYAGSLDWLCNPASVVSSHFLLGPQGQIAQLVSLNDVAWTNGLYWDSANRRWLTPRENPRDRKPVTPRWLGMLPGVNPNRYTITIESAGRSGEALTPAHLESLIRLLAWIRQSYGWSRYIVGPTTPGANLIGHCDINPIDKGACPGAAFDFAAIARAANSSPPPPPPPAPGSRYTAESPILGPSACGPAQAVAYILARGSAYDAASVATIVDHYWRFAPEVGIDPVLALAQCIHETSAQDPATGAPRPLSSWWAQRPRRNPAGIGVNGRTSSNPPGQRPPAGPGEDWAYRAEKHRWEMGLSFLSWELAVRAHVGRLLAYACRDSELNGAQRALVQEALAWRELPAALRGSAPTLRLLGASQNPTEQGWAYPGDGYGSAIAAVANGLVTR